MSRFLRHSYRFAAPFYDVFLRGATDAARRRSLSTLHGSAGRDVLLLGVGTGLDLPHLPAGHRYVGLDLTTEMLARALPRAAPLDFRPLRGDAQRLPFADASFDAVVLHLILAVVPTPALCLGEAARVVRPGGELLVFDKFLRRGEGGWRRALTPLTRHVATRLDVVFEDVLASVRGLEVEVDEPALAGDWFRLIRLRKPIS